MKIDNKVTMKYIAIFGGNLMACPAVNRIKGLGYRVVVVDGNPDSPAQKIADHFVNQNFSDIEKTEKALKCYELEGIIPLNDFAVKAATHIARTRGLPCWNEFAAKCVTSKIAMKQAWNAAGLPTARYFFSTVSQLLEGQQPEWKHWPSVIKPSFSGGGSRGVFIANNWQELTAGLRQRKESYLDGELVVEEFIAGTEHTLEVLVRNEEPFLLSISDKKNYPGSHTVVQNLYFPGPVGHSARSRLEPLVYAACKAMQLNNGAAHFEVIVNGENAYLLEVGGRPGGGLNFHPICELSTGYNYPGMLAAILTGHEFSIERKAHQYLAWHYFPVGTGILKDVSGFEDVCKENDVIDAQLYEKIGKERFDLKDDLARPGYILVCAESHQAAKHRACNLIDKVKFFS